MDVEQRNPYDLGVATSFPDEAKRAVVEYHNARAAETTTMDKPVETYVTINDVYTIWFAKTLQNWKAIASTTIPNGRIYEITYDGDKHQMYIDVYEKKDNLVVPD